MKKSFKIYTTIIAAIVTLGIQLGMLNITIDILDNKLNQSGAGALALLIAVIAAISSVCIFIGLLTLIREGICHLYKKSNQKERG